MSEGIVLETLPPLQWNDGKTQDMLACVSIQADLTSTTSIPGGQKPLSSAAREGDYVAALESKAISFLWTSVLLAV